MYTKGTHTHRTTNDLRARYSNTSHVFEACGCHWIHLSVFIKSECTDAITKTCSTLKLSIVQWSTDFNKSIFLLFYLFQTILHLVWFGIRPQSMLIGHQRIMYLTAIMLSLPFRASPVVAIPIHASPFSMHFALVWSKQLCEWIL